MIASKHPKLFQKKPGKATTLPKTAAGGITASPANHEIYSRDVFFRRQDHVAQGVVKVDSSIAGLTLISVAFVLSSNFPVLRSISLLAKENQTPAT